MKRILSIVLSFIMLLTMSINVSAAETVNKNLNEEYQNYNNLIEEGILSNDITFDFWQEIKEQSAQLEKALETSEEFHNVYDSNYTSDYSMEAGDIFITNGTTFGGLTGHSGIAISSDRILHIAGFGEHPDTLTLSEWNSEYTAKGWTKVYRTDFWHAAFGAALWAKNTYLNSNAEYQIDLNLSSTNKTYCSKLVWQAYYYGPHFHYADKPITNIILPYDLHNKIWNLKRKKVY
nr:hypothetical protein [uncultured Catonella sp.]